jgi:hypothetical protein
MRRPAYASCLWFCSCRGGLQVDSLGRLMGRRHRGSRIDPLAFAIVAKEHFEHVDHASALVDRCGFEGELEGGRYAEVQRVAFNVIESHGMAPQVSVHLRYSSWSLVAGRWSLVAGRWRLELGLTLVPRLFSRWGVVAVNSLGHRRRVGSLMARYPPVQRSVDFFCHWLSIGTAEFFCVL